MSGKIFPSPTSFDKIFKLKKKKVHLLNSTITCCLTLWALPMAQWVKNPPANAGVTGSVPGSKGNGNLHQCSCLKNPMDRGAYILHVCVCVCVSLFAEPFERGHPPL